jgi:hypothetical protein
MMDYIFIILAIFFFAYFVFKIIQFFLDAEKARLERNLEYERQKKILEEYYFRLMTEQMRKSQQTQKHSKWYGLEQSVRDKIVKVKALAERGEGGEKEAAKLKYQKMLQKNNLHPADVPVNLV